MKTKWHLRVRAVIEDGEKFLVFTHKDHCAMLGGHVEEGESVTVALGREILEETGHKCKVGEYLGAIEHAWVEGDAKHWEVTHFFEVKFPGLSDLRKITSAEEDLDFKWIAPRDFEKENLLPQPLRELLVENKKPWWGSTIL